MAETPNVWQRPPIGMNWGDEWQRFNEEFWLAVIGEPGYGKQWNLTQWNGPDYHVDVSSQDTVDGKAGRTMSQNQTFGWRVNNAEFGIVGAPTLDAFTQGSVLFVGASKVLSQDNANLFYDDAADTLKAKNLIVPTKAAIGQGSLGSEVLTVIGNGRISTFLGVGGAPDSTHALLVTGLAEVTSRMGIGGAAHASETLRVTGTMSSSDKAAVKGLTGTEDFVVNGTQQVTTRLGVGGAPDGTAAFKVTGNSLLTGNLTFNSTAQRITADLINATHANRLHFQGTTANSSSVVGVIPNGSGTIGGWAGYNASDPDNAGILFLSSQSTEAKIQSTATGSGTAQPLTLYHGTTKRFEVGATGIGVFASAQAAKQTVTGSRGGNAALASFLTAMATYGWITDSSTA